MFQSIPTGYIPLGNPVENFFERANPSQLGIFFLIPYPGAKSDGQIPLGVGQNFPKLEETSSVLQTSSVFQL